MNILNKIFKFALIISKLIHPNSYFEQPIKKLFVIHIFLKNIIFIYIFKLF